jgi:hypothetical protein
MSMSCRCGMVCVVEMLDDRWIGSWLSRETKKGVIYVSGGVCFCDMAIYSEVFWVG